MNILAEAFPLSWSHYVLLISRSRSDEARQFYHAEALRGGWSVRQLQRQIDSQFYERMALSKDKAVWQRRLRKPGGYWMRGRNEK
jgi:predicted nuclease of restriction endonuclease-like (RecB) superfamily